MGRVDISSEANQEIRGELDRIGDDVIAELRVRNLAPHASPLFQPWALYVGVQSTKVLITFLVSSGGMPDIFVLDLTMQPPIPLSEFSGLMAAQKNAAIAAAFEIDPVETGEDLRAASRKRIVSAHIADVDRKLVLGRLGDISGFVHLEPQLRAFLAEHPDPSQNVFVMMRFSDTAQFRELRDAIVETLRAHRLHGVRADDKDYHPDLWSNVETYMLSCNYGIAAFEDFEERDHNPNVALELGFMRARHKRCLILKERTLPSVPTDIVGALYKAFDKFEIGTTVRAQVERWITVDLGLP
jgi:hypothetical protein